MSPEYMGYLLEVEQWSQYFQLSNKANLQRKKFDFFQALIDKKNNLLFCFH